ncbi:hypothetical protein C0Q70_01489 [Pomacea canaliculata]|uniref:Large ribosomal subunit protein bL12m n=2 Tax=Pomacea canaliculata TaxID=400727 RepID=A0A2T7PZL4_POMCA|nr:hypothetical protein C0Q70_01489 [Pomacea canaliculata]
MQAATSVIRSKVLASNYCRRLALKLQVHRTYMCNCVSTRLYGTVTDAILPPHAEGTERIYPPKIQKLVQDISELTLLEVADLNELLKKTLNIKDAPMMSVGSVAAPVKEVEEEEEAAPVNVKMTFTVKLTKFDDTKKVQLIKEIKSLLPNMNLVQAKKFVESAPQVVKADIPKDEAEKLKEALAAVGGEVEIE